MKVCCCLAAQKPPPNSSLWQDHSCCSPTFELAQYTLSIWEDAVDLAHLSVVTRFFFLVLFLFLYVFLEKERRVEMVKKKQKEKIII